MLSTLEARPAEADFLCQQGGRTLVFSLEHGAVEHGAAEWFSTSWTGCSEDNAQHEIHMYRPVSHCTMEDCKMITEPST